MHLRELRHAFTGLALALLMSAGGFSYSSESPAVALASSFRVVWPSLMEAYSQTEGASRPRASFASSGLLTTQIRHGAPFQLFLSADLNSVQILEQMGKTRDEGISIANGRLSLLAPRSSLAGKDLTISVLKDLLSNSSDQQDADSSSARMPRITIPNPLHAPYGIAAREVLMNAGLWPLQPGQLLAAENAAQTLQFVLSGAVDAAIVPSTLLTEPQPTLIFAELAQDSHDPVVHKMVLTSLAGDGAEHLYAWLQSRDARNILKRFGLSAPLH